MRLFVRPGMKLFLVGLIAALPAAAVPVTWTNVSPAMVTSGKWSNADNWDVGVPSSGDSVRLTNAVNSYIVGVESAPAAFSSLYMSNSGENITELRIGADMDFRPTLTYGFTLSTMNQNAVMDVVSGTTAFYWSAQHAGTFIVRNGATLETRMLSSTGGGLANHGNMTVESGGTWTANNGGMHENGAVITVESGGVWNIAGTSILAWKNPSSSALVITNRGTIVSTANLTLSQNCYTYNTIEQEAGTFSIPNSARTLNIALVGSSPGTTRGILRVTGGLVDNTGYLQVGVNAENWGRATTSYGLVDITGGEYRHGTQLIKVGGWVTAIGSTHTIDFNAVNTVRGEIKVSGGKFSTLGDVLVANGPSRGFVTVSGGEFYVTNAAGTASLLLGGVDDPTLLRSGIATLTVTNGYAEIDRLYATNQVGGANYSIVQLHGGELAVRSILADNGEAFDVGDGTHAATLSLLGGTHTFSDGLVIHTNATLSVGGAIAIGSATIEGNVTLRENARLAWDFNAVDQDGITVNGTVELPHVAILELTSLDASTPKQIPLITASDGFIGKPSAWPRVVVEGVSYGALIENNTLVLTPPRGTTIMIR